MKEKQQDEAVLDATPDRDVPVQLVVPYLNGLNQDVQDDVCKHLTYDQVKAENVVDASLVDLPDVHHDVLLDAVNVVLLKLSRMIWWPYCCASSMGIWLTEEKV